MTLGELYDALNEVRQAEKELENAMQQLGYGGDKDTMARKRQYVDHCQYVLIDVRARELK